jgi:hypothetical protein
METATHTSEPTATPIPLPEERVTGENDAEDTMFGQCVRKNGGAILLANRDVWALAL